jgi:hypothetical protein
VTAAEKVMLLAAILVLIAVLVWIGETLDFPTD